MADPQLDTRTQAEKLADHHRRFSGAEKEAANRAEATALLIRCGYRVYRPEADMHGEDLVVLPPGRHLIPVQLKGRARADWPKYGGIGLWMLFPSAKFDPAKGRQWYLVPHDTLFANMKARHGHAPKWADAWNYPYVSKALAEFLKPYLIKPPAEPEESGVSEVDNVE